MNLQILHEKCDPKLANDKSLPYTTYLVEYELDEDLTYDLVISNKKADIFDYYWDKYRTGFKQLRQSQGIVDPKRWRYVPEQKKKTKDTRRGS